MPYQAEREQLARRQKMLDMLSQQAITPRQTQMVSGRAVPQGILEGISPIIQAMMAKSGGANIAKRGAELDTQQAQGVQDAMRGAMDQYSGKPETKYNLSPEERFGEGDISSITATPEIKADPTGAAMRVATDPYLSQSKPAQAMMQQLMKQKGADTRGGYSTIQHLVGPDGTTRPYKFDHRSQKLEPIENFTSPKYDLNVKRGLSHAGASGKATGGDEGTAIASLPAAELRSEETLDLTQELRTHAGMKDVIGLPANPPGLKGYMPGSPAADFKARLDQITGRTFIEIFPTLKGGGPITDVEGEKGQDSINRLKSATSEKGFMKALDDFDQEVKRLVETTRRRAGKTPKELEPAKPRGSKPRDLEQNIWDAMTPEDQALF